MSLLSTLKDSSAAITGPTTRTRNKAKIVELKRQLYHEFLDMTEEEFNQEDYKMMVTLLGDREIKELLDHELKRPKEQYAETQE